MCAENLSVNFYERFILPVMVLYAAISMAQNEYPTSEKDTISLDEIVITANRIKEKKTDAVANVTVIDKKKLQQFIKIAPDMSHLIGMVEPAMSLSSNTTNNRYQNLRGRHCLCLLMGYLSLPHCVLLTAIFVR